MTEAQQYTQMITTSLSPARARPFLKWAGGKTCLLGTLTEFVPPDYGTYFEPFLGGGAFFFNLAPARAVLADANSELINCFTVVRDETEALIDRLKTFRNTEDYYYSIRGQNPSSLDSVRRAARFVFLNKTCFNGLYRVNRAGLFNTPYANNSNARFLDDEALFAASKAMKGAKLLCADYIESTRDRAKRGDFVYFDPPYLPVSEFSDFKRYIADQVELARVFHELDAKGCRLVLSNSDYPRIRELYSGCAIQVVSASRFVNCVTNN